jgi:hypothetical protein
MIDVVSFLPAKRKQTSSGWISFNAPCCVHRGENADRRQRGGIKLTPEGGWNFHCFNCGTTASFVLGRTLTFKARKLLTWLGVDSQVIEQINLESMRHKSIHGLLEDREQVVKKTEVEFEERDLPAGLELVTEQHAALKEYLVTRAVALDYPYMTNPTNSRPGIVVPFTYKGMMVGSAIRFLDNRTPKYINDIQPGYVFGTDLQQSAWQYAIVVEGVFDALSINGLAVLHNDINPQQVELIKSLGRQVIVVPDQDEAGMKLVDRAVELGWAVSMPEWPKGVKDVNDAVICMGRVGCLLTILQARETSRIKIEMKRKKLVKGL